MQDGHLLVSDPENIALAQPNHSYWHANSKGGAEKKGTVYLSSLLKPDLDL